MSVMRHMIDYDLGPMTRSVSFTPQGVFHVLFREDEVIIGDGIYAMDKEKLTVSCIGGIEDEDVTRTLNAMIRIKQMVLPPAKCNSESSKKEYARLRMELIDKAHARGEKEESE